MYEVIGQEKLLQQFNELKDLPALTILLGPKGSGRTFLSKVVTKQRGYAYIIVNNKISDIRKMIEDTVALERPTVYYISDADNLTTQAANAMLKIAEEPPKNLYIMMGLTGVDSTLSTIVSRGTIFRIEPYTRCQLLEYGVLDDRIVNCANNIGEIIEYVNNDFDKSYKFAELVYNNILKVSTGNAFKISGNIAFKPDDKGIPVELFFNIFLEVLRTHIKDNVELLNGMIKYTVQARRDIGRKGSNKKLIFDIWVLNIRTLRG
ncbi:MAG: hypothetical protein ACI3T9_04430 [Romboutsia timonensis]